MSNNNATAGAGGAGNLESMLGDGKANTARKEGIAVLKRDLLEFMQKNNADAKQVEGLTASGIYDALKKAAKNPEAFGKIMDPEKGKEYRMKYFAKIKKEGLLAKLLETNARRKASIATRRGRSVSTTGIRNTSVSRTRKPKSPGTEKFESDLRAFFGEKYKKKDGKPVGIGMTTMAYAKKHLKPKYPDAYKIPGREMDELFERNTATKTRGAETRRSTSMATKLGVNKAELPDLDRIRKSLEKRKLAVSNEGLKKLRNAIGTAPVEGAISRILGNATTKEDVQKKLKEFLKRGASPTTRKRKYEDCIAKCKKDYPEPTGKGGAGGE